MSAWQFRVKTTYEVKSSESTAMLIRESATDWIQIPESTVNKLLMEGKLHKLQEGEILAPTTENCETKSTPKQGSESCCTQENSLKKN